MDEHDSCDWYLPPLLGGESKGLNDPGIEGFKDPSHLARETVQNIIDAHDPDSGGTATVRFDILDMPVSQIPGIESFKGIFKACDDKVRASSSSDNETSARSVQFMQRGTKQLESQTSMSVLRIRDTNTFGLLGSDNEEDSRWYRLVRGQGTARIEGAGGGTYGIGQRAPFAFSNIRTAFYSTMTAGGSCRFMGKFILCSCEHPDETDPKTGRALLTQNIGYFGQVTGNSSTPILSIDNASSIPEFFRRESVGTDVYIMGFTVDELRRATLRSVLIDFYAAILHDKIVVIVNDRKGEIRVDSGSIQEVMEQELQSEDLTSKEKKELIMARYSLEALGNAPIKKEIDKLGVVQLYVHRSDEATNKVSYMRRPRMRVQSKNCNKLRGYQAVVLVDEKEGSDYLAELENPAHNKWNHKQAAHWSAQQQREAELVLRELLRFVRESLDEIRGSSSGEAEDIPELSQFLPAEDEEFGQEATGGDESDRHTEEETPRRVPREKKVQVVVSNPPRKPETNHPKQGDGVGDGEGVTGAGHGDGGTRRGGSGGGDEEGGGDGNTGGDDPGGRVLTRQEIGFRSWKPAGSAQGIYRIVISPRMNIAGSLALRARGETGLVTVEVLSARDLDARESLPITGGALDPFELAKDEQRNIEIEIASDVDVALTMETR